MTANLATSDPVLADFALLVGEADPVAVAGGRTRWELGGALDTAARVIAAPQGIVEYTPEEMTVKVRAGTTVAELDAALATKGQRSAVPDRGGTVGGAVAVGESDVRALGRGMIRTAPLQVRYVSAERKLISSGGPTVKNVTGFDLPRLMTGALGTLGLIAEVTLRTNPIPAVSRWFSAVGSDPRVAFESVLAPSCVLWDGTTTWVEIEGHSSDVDRQAKALASAGPFAEVDGPPTLPPHRWSLPPAEVLDAPEPAAPHRVSAIGLGLAFAETPQPRRTLTPSVKALSERVKANFDPTGRLNPGRNPGEK